MTPVPSPPGRFLRSFRHAFRGFRTLLVTQPNGRFHLLAAFLVFLAAWFFKLPPLEWLIILICIGLVVSAELLNTAIEKLCDHVTADYHANIKEIKDLAAAAVLMMALVSVVAGLIIFVPRIREYYQL